MSKGISFVSYRFIKGRDKIKYSKVISIERVVGFFIWQKYMNPFYCLESIEEYTYQTDTNVVTANKQLVQAVTYQVNY